jgi:aspartate 1-decarboxylase
MYPIENFPKIYNFAVNSGELCLNGAAGRLAEPSDIIIVISDGMYSQDAGYFPTTILLNKTNDIVSVE